MEKNSLTSLIIFLSLLCSKTFTQALEINPNFGSDGYVSYKHEPFSIHTIDTLRDGRIVLGGKHGLSDQTQFMFKRLLKDGSPDLSFGNNGLMIIPYPSAKAYVFGIRVLDNDHIIATGSIYDLSEDKFQAIVLKIDEHGQLDSNFGNDGFLIFPKAPGIIDDYIIPLEEGEIILGMNEEEEDKEGISFYRITAEGEIIQDFGDGGFQLFRPAPRTRITKAILVDGNRFIVAGKLVTQARTFLARFHLDGSLDSTFSSVGYRILDPQIQNVEDLKVESDGTLLFSDYRVIINATKGYLHRLLPDGSDDTSFGTDGAVALEGLTECERIFGSIIREQGDVLTFGLFPNGNQKEEVILGHGRNGSMNIPSLQLNIGEPILIFRSLLVGNQGVFLGYYDNNQGFYLLNYVSASITNTNSPIGPTSKVHIFPTLFKSQLLIKSHVATQGPIQLQVVSSSGQILKKIKLDNLDLQDVQSIDLGELPNGPYFVQIHQSAGQWETIKVIKVAD